MYSQIESLVLLGAVIVAYTLAVHRIERLRLAVNNVVPNVANTWVLAGVLKVSPPLVIVLVAIIYAAEWPARRAVGAKLYKHVYGGAALAASGLVAEMVIHLAPQPAGVAAAVPAYVATDLALISAVYVVTRKVEVLRRIFTSPRAHAVEVGTAGAGVVLAAGMGISPVLALVALPALALLHQSELRATIRAARAFDRRTGLSSERLWVAQASEIVNRGRYAAVILIDTHGSTERQIPHIIRGPFIRPDEPVGNYEHGWFAVATKTIVQQAGDEVADRIHAALTRAGVSATVGVCCERDWPLSMMLLTAEIDLEASRDRDVSTS